MTDDKPTGTDATKSGCLHCSDVIDEGTDASPPCNCDCHRTYRQPTGGLTDEAIFAIFDTHKGSKLDIAHEIEAIVREQCAREIEEAHGQHDGEPCEDAAILREKK